MHLGNTKENIFQNHAWFWTWKGDQSFDLSNQCMIILNLLGVVSALVMVSIKGTLYGTFVHINPSSRGLALKSEGSSKLSST